MRIAALSDLHIGTRRFTDAFLHDRAHFIRFLDALEAHHDHVVLVGDVYQAEHGPWPSKAVAARELARARRRVPELAERFDAPPYVYVHGNHDLIARDELGAHESVTLGDDDDTCARGARVHFVHGHQYDPIYSGARPAAIAATWFAGRVRAAGLRPVAQWLETRDIEIKDQRFRREHGPYDRAGRALLKQHHARVVVMGHTHVAFRQVVPGGVLVNTGSCSLGAFSWVTIDTDSGDARVVDHDDVARAIEWPAPTMIHAPDATH